MTKAVLGIIGGSGIYDLPGLEKVRSKKIKSPWGEPSAALRVGEIAGTPVVFLSRHDKGPETGPVIRDFLSLRGVRSTPKQSRSVNSEIASLRSQ